MQVILLSVCLHGRTGVSGTLPQLKGLNISSRNCFWPQTSSLMVAKCWAWDVGSLYVLPTHRHFHVALAVPSLRKPKATLSFILSGKISLFSLFSCRFFPSSLLENTLILSLPAVKMWGCVMGARCNFIFFQYNKFIFEKWKWRK